MCSIAFPGGGGTGFVIGPLTHIRTGLVHRLVLTCHHVKLHEAFIENKPCKGVFEGSPGTPSFEVNIVPDILYSNDTMDYVLVCLQHSAALESHLQNIKSLGELVTPFTPKPKEPLVIIGSSAQDKKKIDFGAYSTIKPEMLDDINRHRCNLNLYPLSETTTFYHCHSFGGTSGSPCFSVPKQRLYAMHCGYVPLLPSETLTIEHGILLYHVACDIEKQIKGQSQPLLTVDQLHQLFPLLKFLWIRQ